MVLGDVEDLWDPERMEGVIEGEEALEEALGREWELVCPMESGEEEKEFRKVLQREEDVVMEEEDLVEGEVADGEWRCITMFKYFVLAF